MLKIANDDVTKMYVGTSAVSKAYVETTQVWPNTPDYSSKYFTIEAIDSGTFKFSGNSVDYSVDNGQTWTTLPSNTNSPTVNAGSKILWKSTGLTPSSGAGIGTFSSTGRFNIEGNIMSLHYGDSFTGQTSLSGKDWAYKNMLSGATGLISAENLVLPATTLAKGCYNTMFKRCTNLTTAPALPATTLAQYCYQDLFADCSNLQAAPDLPATTLASGCYYYMFEGCTSLQAAPVLSATTMVVSCYAHMFEGCTGLTTAPVLPATTLATSCYEYMFKGCTSLTTAPDLPGGNIENSVYAHMFEGCTGITTAPVLSGSSLGRSSYNSMFSGCSSLNYIKMTATDIDGVGCLTNWVAGVSATGHFVKATGVSLPSGASGIPTGWTVEADEEIAGVSNE